MSGSNPDRAASQRACPIGLAQLGPARQENMMTHDPFTTVLRRLEGLALAAICIWLFRGIHEPWWLFALLFLAPDASLLGYLAGPRIGAVAYNLVHTWVTPVLLFAIGWWGDAPSLLPVAFALGAHIGVDRALGFGLKLPTGFRDTHLGRIGRRET
jgi:hypothetical protein